MGKEKRESEREILSINERFITNARGAYVNE